MKKDESEMHLMENTNYTQAPATPQNVVYPTAPMPVYAQIPNDGSPDARIMNTKIVRFRLGQRSECNCNGCKAFFLIINTVSRIDDANPQNENEMPLFETEYVPPGCCDNSITYNLMIPQSKTVYGTSKTVGLPIKVNNCCGESYYQLPPVHNFRASNPADSSIINRHDTRSFYRTFEYMMNSYYKIGKPYVEPPCCDSCCKCQPTQSTKCVCCPKVEIVKRIYMDIFNMFDQRVGKFVSFHDVNGCCCCETHNEFYEIYFPADANLMLRLALIGQMIFFFHFGTNLFGSLPGSSDDIGQFIV